VEMWGRWCQFDYETGLPRVLLTLLIAGLSHQRSEFCSRRGKQTLVQHLRQKFMRQLESTRSRTIRQIAPIYATGYPGGETIDYQARDYQARDYQLQ